MSQQTDPAKLYRVSSIDDSFVGQKMRLVGRTTGLILLLEDDHAVLVDVSLCVDHWSGSWVRDYLGIIRVVGHLEASAEGLPIPTMPTYAPAPTLDPTLVIRAVLVDRAADMDMELWKWAIKEREQEQ